ncbi:hypothetical protein CRYUN_Cryun13aG0009500 [Craigia yunnanensis]
MLSGDHLLVPPLRAYYFPCFFLWALFQEGLARLEKRKRWESKERKSALDSLESFQNEAKTARRGIWQYGDVESDDEDTLPPVAAAAKKTGGRR